MEQKLLCKNIMAIWVIITSSLINETTEGRDFERRRTEYISCIKKIISKFQNCNIVIVENNSLLEKKVKIGTHRTFLDTFGIPVLYTQNNRFITRNYGMKELLDVFACITHFNIKDDDFIVKITGRYIIADNCPFINQLNTLSQTNYDSILRYGSYMEYPAPQKSIHCVTGLIGLRCKYAKQMEIPDEDTFVEEKWAKKISELNDSKVCVLPTLGIYIRPELKTYYFLV